MEREIEDPLHPSTILLLKKINVHHSTYQKPTTMCFCNDSNQAFAWIGAVLVNFGFISLITWGATTFWVIGCFLSAVYTVFLASLANYVEHYEESSTRIHWYS